VQPLDDQLFARPRFAEHQHAQIGACHHVDGPQQLAERSARADEGARLTQRP
jgi:hypothetical protein